MAFLGRGRLPLCCALLFCLLLGCVSVESITAKVGSDITLPCNYDAQRYGRLSVCWGRGAVPNSGCNNEVIRSDGTSVTSQLSKRYLLMGDLGGGDVSLTIKQVEKTDSGMYGCRVEIPGWFNDHKHQVTLTVEAAPPDPLRLEKKEVKEKSITFGWTSGFDGGEPIISYNFDYQESQGTWQTDIIEHGVPPQLTLVDLRPATTYKFRMFAINSVGKSEVSNLLIVRTREAAPDGPPLDLQLESLSSHSIRVTWKPPEPKLRNGILLSYSLNYREYDHASKQYKRWQHVNVPASKEIETVILGNLKPSASYGVIVQAKTSAGIGPAATAPLCSTLAIVSTTKSAPTPATIWMQDVTSIPLVHTTSTVSTSKSASTPATIRIQDTTSIPLVHSTTADEPSPTATVGEELTASTTLAAPDAPVVELKEVQRHLISLSWTPGFDGGSPITGYYLEYKEINNSWDYTDKTRIDFKPGETEATILEINRSTYNIRMFAKNSHGTSKASNVVTVTIEEKAHEIFTTASADNHATDTVKEESKNVHPATIVVPVVLVVLIVAIVAAWQVLRMKKKTDSLNIWLTGGAPHFRSSEPLQEL